MGSKKIQVVAALIEHQGKILIAQRPSQDSFPHKWEFPGGKIRSGEEEVTALRRELQEELGVKVCVHSKVLEANHDYPSVTVALNFFHCSLLPNQQVQPKHHQALAWVWPGQVGKYDLLEANRSLLSKIETLF